MKKHLAGILIEALTLTPWTRRMSLLVDKLTAYRETPSSPHADEIARMKKLIAMKTALVLDQAGRADRGELLTIAGQISAMETYLRIIEAGN